MKSGFPYLVDIKISDYCPFGCKFCYQSSTKEGEHADNYYLSQTLPKILQDAGVFEVNFGGGEPTLNPKLLSIVSGFKSKLFKIGITTKNYNWHKSDDFKDILKSIDSVAISVNSQQELEKAVELGEKIYPPKVYFQCVFELNDYDSFKEFVGQIPNYSNLTLLGFKDFGFGQNCHKYNYPSEWIDFLKEESEKKHFNIGIDSVMVKNWGEELKKSGVKPYYLVGREGESTCFIDAVKKRVYSSSFSNEDGFDLPKYEFSKGENFLDLFAKL